jgi:hypothetical protein
MAVAWRLAGSWWAFLLAGIAWVIIAVVILRFNIASVATIGILLGAVFLLSPVEEFVALFRGILEIVLAFELRFRQATRLAGRFKAGTYQPELELAVGGLVSSPSARIGPGGLLGRGHVTAGPAAPGEEDSQWRAPGTSAARSKPSWLPTGSSTRPRSP